MQLNSVLIMLVTVTSFLNSALPRKRILISGVSLLARAQESSMVIIRSHQSYKLRHAFIHPCYYTGYKSKKEPTLYGVCRPYTLILNAHHRTTNVISYIGTTPITLWCYSRSVQLNTLIITRFWLHLPFPSPFSKLQNPIEILYIIY